MQNSAISDMNATPAPYTQTGALRDGNATQGIASAKSAEEAASTPAPSTGDSVSISQEAREAAELKANGTSPASPSAQETPPVKEPVYSPIKTVTTSDGTEVKFEASYTNDVKGHKQTSSVRVNFTGKDGESYSHTLNESSILTQDENGRWQVSQIQGNSVTGSEEDDIIILLPTGKPATGLTDQGVQFGHFSEDKTTLNVDAGDGNNVVMDFSGDTTKISTGSGNDTIVGSNRTGRFVVHSGAGDDSIELSGRSAYVYSGDGDDTLIFDDITARTTHTGSGDDKILFKGKAGVARDHGGLHAGEGDDYIEFEGDPSGTIFGDDGDDTITFKGTGGTAHIYGGNGDDAIKGKSTGGSYHIDGGDGDDVIKLNGVGTTHANGGDGNDYIQLYSTGGTAYIDGGNGDDTIVAGVNGGSNYIFGGDGDDLIYAYSQGNVSDYATIFGGNGADIILVNNNSTNIDQNEIDKILQEIKKQKNKQKKPIQEDIFNYDKYIENAAMGIHTKENPSYPSDNEQNIQTAAPAPAQHDQSQRRQALVAYGRHI